MWILKIFGIFGFMTGPALISIIGAFASVKVWALLRWALGWSGTAADAASGGVFVGTTSALMAATETHKLRSKFRVVRRAIVAFGDDVDSPKPDK